MFQIKKTNCSELNGINIAHKFQIQNEDQEEYKFIRMRLIGRNWRGDNTLVLGSFEIYGTLI